MKLAPHSSTRSASSTSTISLAPELAILEEHTAAMAEAIGDDCELIEFGSGSGLKTRLLLEQVRSPRAYLPVDIAREHLERSALDLADRFPDLRILPVHADFTEPLLLPETGDPRARRVVYFPGSTIGNFSPRAATSLLCTIAWLVGEGGGLLGRLRPRQRRIDRLAGLQRSARASPATFVLNLLRANQPRTRAPTSTLTAFSHRADYVRSKECMEMHLVSREPEVVRIAGMEFAFRAGRDNPHSMLIQILSRSFQPVDSARAGFTAWPASGWIPLMDTSPCSTWSLIKFSPVPWRDEGIYRLSGQVKRSPERPEPSRAAGIAPSKRIIEMSSRRMPVKIGWPKPPAPIRAPIVAVPTLMTAAVLIPARIEREAIGNSIRSRRLARG